MGDRMPDALTYLLGTWRVSREIEDRRSGRRSSFVGTATFEPGPDDRLAYREEGELRHGGHVGHAARSLVCEPGQDGIMLLRFADGRPFVRLDLSDGGSDDVHVCGLDRYEIETRVASPDVFSERWRVRGPAKDYEALARLVRAERPAETQGARSRSAV